MGPDRIADLTSGLTDQGEVKAVEFFPTRVSRSCGASPARTTHNRPLRSGVASLERGRWSITFVERLARSYVQRLDDTTYWSRSPRMLHGRKEGFDVRRRRCQEYAMEIVRLPVGKQASADVDCIRIEELGGSTFRLTASALCVETDDGDSVSIIDGPLFDTIEQAEVAGIAWATNVGVERLFVSTGTLEQPLEVLEMDKPL
jgi:hypothetical protein